MKIINKYPPISGGYLFSLSFLTLTKYIIIIISNTEVDIMINNHRIVYVKGHYEVQDDRGNFVLSGDTWEECYSDLLDIVLEG